MNFNQPAVGANQNQQQNHIQLQILGAAGNAEFSPPPINHGRLFNTAQSFVNACRNPQNAKRRDAVLTLIGLLGGSGIVAGCFCMSKISEHPGYCQQAAEWMDLTQGESGGVISSLGFVILIAAGGARAYLS